MYAFALRTGLSWAEAEALDAEMAEIYEPLASEAAGKRKEEWNRREREFREQRKAEMNRIKAIRDDSRRKRYGLEFKEVYIASVRKNEDPDFFTSRMRDEFAGVRTREDLEAFFRENSADMGRLHESAYEKFWELLIRLQEPEILLEDELGISSFSLKDISDLYFRMHVPRQKNIKNFTYLQKMIKKNWPDYSELQRMKSRTVDVSRKVILLLFLITGDFLEEEETPDEKKNVTEPYSDTIEAAMEEMEDRRDSVGTYTVSSEMSALLEDYGIMPEEVESFGNTRDSDLYNYLLSLETVYGCFLYAEEFSFQYENLSYYYELDMGIHESERGYYYYGCLNYWFAEWEEEQVDLVREQVIDQLKDYLPETYTWETDPDVVEQKVMLYLDEVEAYLENMTERLGEQIESLMTEYPYAN
ncbi:MAG: hypothetical protein LUG27_06960 [Clostridiales bacterium]|nr:hypothetical protein [Clostridiales bacterium]